MPEPSRPLLVYNRIDHNRRAARLLLTAFGIAALPVASAGAILLVPFVSFFGAVIAFAMYGRSLEAKLEALDQAMSARTISMVSELPGEILTLIVILLGVALFLTFVLLVAATAFLIARFGARMVLRLAGAHVARREERPELFQVVENLCIGAGLQMPQIYLIDSDAANAFATGRDPARASLAVTTGLLTLLDRRQLEGVVAHELSHIGNHDIRLTTTLAAVVGTLSLPLRMMTAPISAAFQAHVLAGAAALAVGGAVLLIGLVSLVASVAALVRGELAAELPLFLRWYAAHAMVAPAYAVMVAPIIAFAIRGAVSRQREFLADADAALLTLDPEGLAGALERIGTAGGRLRGSDATAHAFIVDPYPSSIVHRLFPSHPPLDERIALLRRMSSG
jgi:heat shock protein HtpX